MDRKTTRFYTTGDFAAFFGIKRDTLLYYDRIGLFSPAIRDQNGYRYYSEQQLNAMETILILRNIGIPIDKIKECCSADSPEKLLSLFLSEKENLEKKIRSLAKIHAAVTFLTEQINDSMEHEDEKVEIRIFGREMITESFADDNSPEITDDEEWRKLSKALSKESGRADMLNQGARIKLEDLNNGQCLRVSSIFVHSSHESNSEIPAGTYAVIYTSRPYPDFDIVYAKLFDEIARLGYKAVSDSFEEYILCDITEKSMDSSRTRIRIRIERS